MKLSTSIFILLLVAMVSCDKNDDTPQEEQELSEPNFYALNVGNSWRYEYFQRIDRTDEFESLDAFDDVTIIGTSEINGNTYYTFETTTTGSNNTSGMVPDNGTAITNLRDSLGYLINENGLKYFSYSNINQEYLIRDSPNDTNIYGMLTDENTDLQVAAGDFECSVNEVYARFSDGSPLPSKDFYFYSKEIGQIKTTCSFVSDTLTRVEKRLVSYTIPN